MQRSCDYCDGEGKVSALGEFGGKEDKAVADDPADGDGDMEDAVAPGEMLDAKSMTDEAFVSSRSKRGATGKARCSKRAHKDAKAEGSRKASSSRATIDKAEKARQLRSRSASNA